ncbi:MAG: Alkaline phosphatase [Myxococcaceae bacterium]|nr:Alkaline phosphatase [Myxococcaceae bacterium]
MRTGRSYVATAFALGIISLMGCAADSTGSVDTHPRNEDWGDETKYPELGGAYASLVAVTVAPTFVTGTLTITSAVDETIIVGKRAVDSAILVNGIQYGGVTSATLKKLVITGTTGDQIVILDFLGGVFAPGIATARGISVDLGAATTSNALRIRGTSAVDTFSVGSDGVSFNADNFRDIDVVWTNTAASFALAGGNDVLTATAAGKGVTGSATAPLTIYGGLGNDVILGGSGSDIIYGGPGADTISGGGTGAGGEKDYLYGEAGADIIGQDAANNGQDFIYCGTESPIDPAKPVVDLVSYAARGTVATRDSTNAASVATTDAARVWVTVGNTSAPDTTGPGNLPDGYLEYAADDGYLVPAGDLTSPLVAFNPASDVTVEADSVAADCEQVTGGQDNDILTGDANPNTLSGGTGDDVLSGLAGADVLNGDAGDDTFAEDAASNDGDVFNGLAGTDTVDYSLRIAVLNVSMDGKVADDGESGETDNVKGDVENVIGGTQGDTIVGNALNNKLTGGLGADTLNGGAGDDTFAEGDTANGGDVFIGGLGEDLVDYSLRANAVTVTMDGVAADDGEAELDNVSADVEDCNGGAGVDSITGNDLDNVIHGGAGADTLISGGKGDDFLDGDADVAVAIVCGEGDDIAVNGPATRDVSCEL